MHTEYRTKRKIEFSDTDMAGIVHFSRFLSSWSLPNTNSYAVWEQVSQLNGKEIKSGGPDLPLPVNILAPYDLKMKWTSDFGYQKRTKSLTYQFHFTHEGKDIARGQLTTVCCITNPGEKIRAIPIPEFITSQIDTK